MQVVERLAPETAYKQSEHVRVAALCCMHRLLKLALDFPQRATQPQEVLAKVMEALMTSMHEVPIAPLPVCPRSPSPARVNTLRTLRMRTAMSHPRAVADAVLAGIEFPGAFVTCVGVFGWAAGAAV